MVLLPFRFIRGVVTLMEVLNSSSEREEACGIRSPEKKEYNVNNFGGVAALVSFLLFENKFKEL